MSVKIAHVLTRKPKLVVTIAVLLLIPCFLGMVATRINYDILTYLPPELDSTRGEALLEEPFRSAATSMLIVENMPPNYTNELRKKIADVPGVSNVVWLSSLVGIQIPTDMFTEELREKFYSGDSTIMIIQYDMPGASERTMEAIDSIRRLVNKQCFLAGFSVLIKDTKDLVDKDLPVYVTLAVIFSYIAMSLSMDSWLLPVALLLCTGMAIIYNMGTNINGHADCGHHFLQLHHYQLTGAFLRDIRRCHDLQNRNHQQYVPPAGPRCTDLGCHRHFYPSSPSCDM